MNTDVSKDVDLREVYEAKNSARVMQYIRQKSQESELDQELVLFLLEFETIHPFNDGNGRIGRILINFQLLRMGYPILIIRDKEKHTYYQGFNEYLITKKADILERELYLALMESLHRRIAYLTGTEIIEVAKYAKSHSIYLPKLLNAAGRQTIPAFREKSVWKIGADYVEEIK